MNKVVGRSTVGRIFIALLAIVICLTFYFLLPESFPEPAKRVAAIMLFAVLFWAFEVIPLYATSLLVVLLLTLTLTSPVNLIKAPTGLLTFLEPFASPIIMLFLGGLVLASVTHRHKVDLYLIQKMFTHLGHRTFSLLLGVLAIGAFFSMWISNTAATAMMLMLIKPMIQALKKGDAMVKRLILATTFGASIGGIATPIGTPPNAIALGILREGGVKVDFLQWMIITLPFVLALLLLTAALLILFFPSKTKKISCNFTQKIPLSKEGKVVLYAAFFIIFLWLTNPFHNISESLVALLGVAFFAAFKLITIEDLRSLPWDVLILMWGGLALGEAVQRSGLIEEVTTIPFLRQEGLSLMITFSAIALFFTSFISNTATANLLLPIALNLDPTHKIPLAISIALTCSFSFSLPISTPGNALAYGTGYISTWDMLKVGGLLSILATAGLIAAINFRLFDYFIP